ncbi:MAG: hypothetical protein O7H41_03380 [Planctomycetota bacterium]|nr:hypothetical protein [Planctomycetota bacterium]
MTRQPMTKPDKFTGLIGFPWGWVLVPLIVVNVLWICFSFIYWGLPLALDYPPLDRLLFYRGNNRFINSTNDDLVVTLLGSDPRYPGRLPLRCAVTGWKFRTNRFRVKSGDEVTFDYSSGFMSNVAPDTFVVEDSKGNLREVLYRRGVTQVDNLEDLWPARTDVIRDWRKPISAIPSHRYTNALIPLASVSIQVILILAYRRLRRRRSKINKRERDHGAMDPRE